MALTVRVLGSAAGGAFPQWNCRCELCNLAWSGDPRVKHRTQASLAVSAEGGKWALLNACPDLGMQIRSTPALHPKDTLRGSPIQAVVLTGAEIDQIGGLLSLRENTSFTLYASSAVHAVIARNEIFRGLRAVKRQALVVGDKFRPTKEIEARLLSVAGKSPFYLEGSTFDAELNTGVEIRSGGKKLLFIPGAAGASPALLESISDADLILFDGTLFTDDEMQKTGTGTKTGREMGHMPIEGAGGTLSELASVSCRRVFIHINNTNPVLMEGSPACERVQSAGWEIAHDGMEFVL
jgi:pyrroloquinoline quinone biosynthesis protein B